MSDPRGHRSAAGYGRILGMRTITIGAGTNEPQQVTASVAQGPAQTIYAPRVSGILRLWWCVSSVITAPATASPPRVFVRWNVHDEGANGNLLNPPNASDPASRNRGPELVCDAWYGQIEVSATSAALWAGFSPGDTPSGEIAIQGVITEGGTGSEQIATFSRYLSIAVPPGTASVYVPGATNLLNNGAHRAKSATIFASAAVDTTVAGIDWAGNTIQLSRTGAPAAPSPALPAPILLHPSVQRLDLTVASAILNGHVLFNYF